MNIVVKEIDVNGGFGKIVNKLKEVMDQQGISVNKMSNLTNIKYEIVKKYYYAENYNFNNEILAKFCYVLNCNVEDLIAYDPN